MNFPKSLQHHTVRRSKPCEDPTHLWASVSRAASCIPNNVIECPGDTDTFMSKTARLYSDTRTASAAAGGSSLDHINDDLQDVTRIMTKNMEELLWRGDSLDRVFFMMMSVCRSLTWICRQECHICRTRFDQSQKSTARRRGTSTSKLCCVSMLLWPASSFSSSSCSGGGSRECLKQGFFDRWASVLIALSVHRLDT